jgi:hypothetical protein
MVIGDYDTSQYDGPQEIVVGIKQTIAHRDFNNQTYENDIALLRLATPVDTKIYRPIKLATSDDTPEVLRMIGWGKIKVNEKWKPAPLREIDLPVVLNYFCYKLLEKSPYKVTENNICTGGPGKGTYKGDSGGPLFSPKGILYGLASVCFQKKNEVQASLFTQVSRYRNWIAAILANHPQLLKTGENVYVFDNQAGPSWWIGCLYRRADNSIAEEECRDIVNAQAVATWDIYHLPLEPHLKIIKPHGIKDSCLTAVDKPGVGHTVALEPCSQASVGENQKWNWWVNSPDDEAYAKTAVFNWDCLDANSGSVWVYGCKRYDNPDRQNQLWQFGTNPDHW